MTTCILIHAVSLDADLFTHTRQMTSLIVTSVLAYRPANLGLASTVTRHDIRQSVQSMIPLIANTSNATTRLHRTSLVSTVADDIVFDALSGSRSGTVLRASAAEQLQKWNDTELDGFDTTLLRAQVYVFACQTLYVLAQSVAVLFVARVVYDLTHIKP